MNAVQKLSEYLKTETSEGKTEFRLVAQDLGDGGTKIYMHPLGKDGKTFDAVIKNEELIVL